MKQSYTIIIVLVLLIAGVWFFMGQDKEAVAPEVNDINVEVNAPVNTESLVAPVESSIKEFTVDGNNFAFLPRTMTVKKGDTVKINFKNREGFHDFVIDEFKASTKQIKTGESESITFVADKSGTFEYYCSVGNHRAMGMKGTLTVE